MKSKYKNNIFIIGLLWLASSLCIGNFAYAQTGAATASPVEILIAEPEFSMPAVTNSLFQQAKKYHDGNGVEQDFSRAHALYLKAADLGNNDARINLGYLYFMGEGVGQDYAKARNLYLSAAKNGSKDAQSNLAMIYQHGFGVPKDIEKANYWRTYVETKAINKKPKPKPVARNIETDTVVRKTTKPKPIVTPVKTKKPTSVVDKVVNIEKPISSNTLINDNSAKNKQTKTVIEKLAESSGDQAVTANPKTQEPAQQTEKQTRTTQAYAPPTNTNLSAIGDAIIVLNKKVITITQSGPLRAGQSINNKQNSVLPQWVSNTLAAMMFTLVLVTSFWFTIQYTVLGKKRKARVFARAFYAHHRDRLRVNYLRYPKIHRKIDTMNDSWAAALCVLMVKFAQSQENEDTLVGMQSSKIIQALKESPFKAKEAVFPFVKITQHRIFDDIQAHECNFKDKTNSDADIQEKRIKEALPEDDFQEVLPVVKARKISPAAEIKDVLTVDKAKAITAPAKILEVLPSAVDWKTPKVEKPKDIVQRPISDEEQKQMPIEETTPNIFD